MTPQITVPSAEEMRMPVHIHNRTPSKRERLAAWGIAAAVLAAAAATLPAGKHLLPTVPAFLPMFIAVIMVLDLCTVFLLLSEFQVSRRFPQVILAGAYLYAALITVPHILTFPGVFSDTGLLGAGSQSAVWLWVFWHGGFPLLLLGYVLAERYAGRSVSPRSAARLMWLVPLGAVACVAAAALAAIWGNDVLPTIIQKGNYRILITSGVGPVVWAINLAACLALLLQLKGRSVLTLWLTAASFAFFMDVTLTLFSGTRYSAGWYMARLLSVVSAGLVMSKMLLELKALYYRSQQLYEDHRRKSDRLAALNHKMRQDQEHIHSLLESTREGMMMCDAEGTILFVNSRCEAIVGESARVGQHFREWFRKLEPRLVQAERLLASLDRLWSGEAQEIHERAALAAGGENRHLEFYAVQVGELNEVAWGDRLIVITDRTQEEEMNERKIEFVSIVSHELRTPLTSIRGFVELLLSREVAPDKGRKYLGTVLKEASRLSDLLDDFLDLQRMEAGKQEYRFEELELKEHVAETLQQWSGRQPQELRLSLPAESCPVRADADRLRQVLHNLISNAVKYSPGADRIDLRVRLSSGEAVVEVQDYGLGIPDEAKPYMFTKFYRVDNTDRRKIGGTGLGLAIIKDIVEAHGGRVGFESVYGRGTTFSFTLPLQA
ncbi:MASE4 domain-containing protein [Gorillibacterium sp. sgz5001074]|uniref:MASE4 domain-containing protein n=1 Tax=Gorillibacterium sp. sgz5001074 TaxID=3446695 RepID=UPI003F67458F